MLAGVCDSKEKALRSCEQLFSRLVLLLTVVHDNN